MGARIAVRRAETSARAQGRVGYGPKTPGMVPDSSTVPAAVSDPVNAAILAVSEDRLSGFQADPFGEIAQRSGIGVDVVIERIVAMLRAGTIRRVRQTVMSTSLARGSLVAWIALPVDP